MKLGFGICYYEDLAGLKRLFSTIPKEYIKIAIDGKYKQFAEQEKNIKSSIGCHYFLEQQENTIHFWSWPDYPTEIEKRNKYLELADDLDFLIVVDSDEYFVGDWSIFEENLEKLKERIYKENVHHQMRNLHFIAMQDAPSTRISNRPRIIYQPSKIRYFGCHYTWIHVDTKDSCIYTDDPAIAGIQIIHDATQRSKEYEENMHRYQIEQKKIEDNNLIYTPLPK
ncbi:MAG: hypothetical protein CV087_11320 [Candidatus Brocadia sp. WS118]|nr:MAG: hypothetical protein CV087_11320 [Candidatus Brocadia sp. WS118]